MSRSFRLLLAALALLLPTMPALALDGPTSPQGVEVRDVVALDLAGQIPAGQGRVLRSRLMTIAPGGHLPVHDHRDRPAVIYFLSGTIVEHREGVAEPIVHTAGSGETETVATIHWWENTGSEPAVLLVTDILRP
jgi:quercetin dioxygenase-like cupin family protein